jgi:hypothetical protein
MLQKITYYFRAKEKKAALQPNVFLTGIHRFLVTNMGE